MGSGENETKGIIILIAEKFITFISIAIFEYLHQNNRDEKPSQDMLDIINSDNYLFLDSKINEILLKRRANLWISGKKEDIKKGKYFVQFNHSLSGKHDINNPADWTNREKRRLGTTGWFCGLENNVKLEVGGKNVLVMDNHNFAAPFIIKMFRENIINENSSMIHIDMHPDCGGTPGFNLDDYINISEEKEKIKYVLAKTSVGQWLYYPLFYNNVIDDKKWQWLTLDNDKLVKRNTKEEIVGTIDNLQRDLDVADVDLDFLLPIDKKLTDSEKGCVLQGKFPKIIRSMILEVAKIAKLAKVITIATSPAYINQQRAIAYAKLFLDNLEAL
jgi:hypothetical protein